MDEVVKERGLLDPFKTLSKKIKIYIRRLFFYKILGFLDK